jgi:CelD/BcsL family acetyltransferase involved in cellulose biosynthesis
LSATRNAIRYSTITESSKFAALAHEWDALVRAMPRPSPFLLHAWIVEWFAHYGGRSRRAIHVAYRDGALVAALPTMVRRRWGLNVSSFVGGSTSVLADILLAPDEDPSTAARLTAMVADECDLAFFFGLPRGSNLGRALGGRATFVDRLEAPVLDLSGGWEAAYRAKTTSRRRNLHSRRRKQLARTGHVTMSVAQTPEELAAALEDAFVLHARRWRGRPDASDFGTAIGRDFHRRVLAALAREGIPRIVMLRLDGRPIAFHYFFLLENRMYVHRLAFEPQFAQFSPGLLNTLDAIAVAADAGATLVEFLGGDERYKLELADRLDPLTEAIGLASGGHARTVALARCAALRLRARLKQSPVVREIYFERLGPLHRVVRGTRATVRGNRVRHRS